MVDEKKFKETADGLGYTPGKADAAWQQASGGRADVPLADLHAEAGKPSEHRSAIEDVATELE